MKVYSIDELRKLVAKVDKKDLYINICKNIKTIRKERYNEFKKLMKENKINNTINPYTTESIAELLDYNHTHYKRFESSNDKTKMIPLDKIIKLSLILDVDINEIIK